MGSFWIILLVVFILLSRSAGKKISGAAQKDMTQLPPVPPFPQVFPTLEEENGIGETEAEPAFPEEIPAMEVEPLLPEEAPKAVVPDVLPKQKLELMPEQTTVQATEPAAVRTTKLAPASQKKDDKKKIDLKKMVVYSEIFRAKYQE